MFKFVHHVHYVVADVDAVVRYMEESFDMKPDHQEDVEDGGYKEALYSAGQTLIEFTQPTKEGTGLSDFLVTHGPGVYHVAWGVDNIEERAGELAAKGRKLRGEGGHHERPGIQNHQHRALGFSGFLVPVGGGVGHANL
ncbi:MAG: VOC family protein [Chloroflexota bacterium]